MTSVPPPSRRPTLRSAWISAARSRMPRMPPPTSAVVAEAAPVVGDAQRQAVGRALEDELAVRRAGVADDVRQRLLGDAVDDELLLARQRRQLAVEVRLDLEAGLLARGAR